MALSHDGYPTIMLSGTDRDLPQEFENNFDKYSDFRQIFNGRKATLEACWDSVMGRLVALKTLKPQFCETLDDRRRFLREARVTAQLAHPNTVPVYEIGCKKGGVLYFTMKLLRGEDLYDVIKKLAMNDPRTAQHFQIPDLIEIFLQVSQALAFAHAHGVIHRDIKPENVWLGQFGEVVLLDWGVAKVWGVEDPPWEPEDLKPHRLAADERPQLRTLTRSGQLPGTPLYMSPEQILGHRSLDERSDVFSMGVMLYELMTLKEPFKGQTVRKTFDQIIHDEPILPSERTTRPIPPGIEEVIMQALRKEAKDRFQSIPEMIDAIRATRPDPLEPQE